MPTTLTSSIMPETNGGRHLIDHDASPSIDVRRPRPEIHIETQEAPSLIPAPTPTPTPTAGSFPPASAQPLPPYPGVIPGFDNRPTTPSTAPSLFQPLSPVHTQYPSSPSGPPSISSLPSNSVVPSVSPSLAPYPYFGILNPSHRIGISPPSPLLRHFGSPSPRPMSPFSTSAQHQYDSEQTPSRRRDFDLDDIDDDVDNVDLDDTNDTLLHDSKDVLAQRLCDLSQRIALSPRANMDSLHSKGDEMERSLTSRHGSSSLASPARHYPSYLAAMSLQNSPSHTHHSVPATATTDPGERFWHTPRSPPWIRPRQDTSSKARMDSKMCIRGISTLSTAGASGAGTSDKSPPQMVPVEDMKRVIDEAERLNSELVILMKNLRARQEESDHIHGLLVERAERAAQRIIFLQGRVHYLEDELQTNDTDLQNLRIQLKAIEVQCPPPDTLDPDLRQSIENWKDDWAALRRKRAARMAAEAAAVAAAEPGEEPDLVLDESLLRLRGDRGVDDDDEDENEDEHGDVGLDNVTESSVMDDEDGVLENIILSDGSSFIGGSSDGSL